MTKSSVKMADHTMQKMDSAFPFLPRLSRKPLIANINAIGANG